MIDFQATLLSYFSQELVSHSAILLGIIAAFFPFMRFAFPTDRTRPNSRIHQLLDWIPLTGLLSGGVYVTGKLFTYGTYVYYTIVVSPTQNESSLYQYYTNVRDVAASRAAFSPILSWFGSLLGPGAILSLIVGGVVALLAVQNFEGRRRLTWRDIVVYALILAVSLTLLGWMQVNAMKYGIFPGAGLWQFIAFSVFYGLGIPWICVFITDLIDRKRSASSLASVQSQSAEAH